MHNTPNSREALRALFRALLPDAFRRSLYTYRKRVERRLFAWRYGDSLRVLDGFRERRGELERELAAPWERYVAEVSIPEAAISFECAVLLAYLCELRRPRIIWDLGSGLSTFVFARYGKDAPHGVRVVSCDEEPEWLERSAAFLARYGLAAQLAGDWRQLVERHAQPPPDLVLVDYTIPQRLDILRGFGPHLAPETLLCVDDVQKGKVRLAAQELIAPRKLRFLDLGPLTQDRFGRTQWLICRPGLFERA